MPSVLHKLAAWIFLAAYLLSGVAPAQELVVCLEPDGTVALEAAFDEGCAPCGSPEELSRDAGGIGVDCCPCTDLPLPSQCEEPQARLKGSTTRDSLAAAVPLPRAAVVAGVEPVRSVLIALAAPRSAPGLAQIRTVVLRV